MAALDLLDVWSVARAAAAVVDLDGVVLAARGDLDATYPLASVTKLLTATAVHLAAEEGSIALDDVLIESGATFADVLAHASGLGPDGAILAPPRARRIYSNAGYATLAAGVAQATGLSFAEYLEEGVIRPLGMANTVLVGDAGAGAESSVADLARLVGALSRPGLLATESLAALTTPYLPTLAGVLPGFGRQDPNPWGMGAEVRGLKRPHWTAPSNSAATFGHFGQSGTFVWVDPIAGIGLVALTDRAFGPWAVDAWPALSESVLVELGAAAERLTPRPEQQDQTRDDRDQADPDVDPNAEHVVGGVDAE